jgi:hypothetical protein
MGLRYPCVVIGDEEYPICTPAGDTLSIQCEPTHKKRPLLGEVVAVYRVHDGSVNCCKGTKKPSSTTMYVHQLRLELPHNLAQLKRHTRISSAAEEIYPKALDTQRVRLFGKVRVCLCYET